MSAPLLWEELFSLPGFVSVPERKPRKRRRRKAGREVKKAERKETAA